MPRNAATPEPGSGVSGDLGRFGASQGRDGGTTAVAANPREGTAQVLADAVMLALRSGDLVAARAAAKSLDVFVDALGSHTLPAVPDIGAARRIRGNKPR